MRGLALDSQRLFFRGILRTCMLPREYVVLLLESPLKAQPCKVKAVNDVGSSPSVRIRVLVPTDLPGPEEPSSEARGGIELSCLGCFVEGGRSGFRTKRV